MDSHNSSSISQSIQDCHIFLFAKSHLIEIKEKLQKCLGFEYNIIAVRNPDNNFSEALISMKRKLKQSTKEDYVIMFGGLNGVNLDTNQYSINDFCSSLNNINIILCGDKFNDNLKMTKEENRNVKFITYPLNLEAQDIINYVCPLLQKEIQKDVPNTSYSNIQNDSNVNDDLLKSENTSTPLKERVNTEAASTSKANTLKRKKENEASPEYKAKTKPRSCLIVANQNRKENTTTKNDLKEMINKLTKYDKNIDVVCITEHKIVDSDINIENFKLIHNKRDSSWLGCSILIRDDLNSVEEKTVNKYAVYCVVKLVNLGIIIISLYRPGGLVYEPENIDGFLKEFKEMLHKYKDQRVIICGAFYIDILKSNKTSNDFRDIIKDCNLSLTDTKGSMRIIHNMPKWNLDRFEYSIDYKKYYKNVILICSLV